MLDERGRLDGEGRLLRRVGDAHSGRGGEECRELGVQAADGRYWTYAQLSSGRKT